VDPLALVRPICCEDLHLAFSVVGWARRAAQRCLTRCGQDYERERHTRRVLSLSPPLPPSHSPSLPLGGFR
jgi:hypothetical protein